MHALCVPLVLAGLYPAQVLGNVPNNIPPNPSATRE